MDNFSEKNLVKKCPHCDLESFAYKYQVERTGNFIVICDVHPLVEGHILIIPKQHLSCVGEFSEELFKEFSGLYTKYKKILQQIYGSISSFEHGKIGQTVFHCHVHLLPFQGNLPEVVSEGEKYISEIKELRDLVPEYKSKGKYLFLSVAKHDYLVNVELGVPRFFRDRFAQALGCPERGDWKEMHENQSLMEKAGVEIMSALRKIKVVQ